MGRKMQETERDCCSFQRGGKEILGVETFEQAQNCRILGCGLQSETPHRDLCLPLSVWGTGHHIQGKNGIPEQETVRTASGPGQGFGSERM